MYDNTMYYVRGEIFNVSSKFYISEVTSLL